MQSQRVPGWARTRKASRVGTRPPGVGAAGWTGGKRVSDQVTQRMAQKMAPMTAGWVSLERWSQR